MLQFVKSAKFHSAKLTRRTRIRQIRTVIQFARLQKHMTEKLAIREVVENWILWRDAGDWERFRGVWTEDGHMMATWFQGSAADFIKVSIEGWNKGVSILHFQGGTSIDVSGNRAISQTKMTISQRATVEDHLVDVVCTGRFYDFLEK